jgi:hypothetical protein
MNNEKAAQFVVIAGLALGALMAADPINMSNTASNNVLQANVSPNVESLSNSKCKATGQKEGQGVLTEDQLNELIKLTPGESKAKVLKVLGNPFCNLPNTDVSKAAPLERPLYFAPGTGNNVVVLSFQGNKYRGYFLTSIQEIKS